MAESEPTLHIVSMQMCSACLDGVGDECHTPGCAFWLNRCPDLPIRNHPSVVIDGADYFTREANNA